MSDGGEGGEEAGDATAVEAAPCDPCFQFCACTPGQTMYAPFQCMTYTCPPTGVWGIMGCTGPSTCADAAEEQPAPVEASSDAPTDGRVPIDSPTDAVRDSPVDASSEEATDAGSEAAGD